MNNNWPVLIISLPDALERQQVMRAQLDALGLSGIFVPAIRGSEISDAERAVLYNDFCVRSHSGRSMTAGELGCALSHLKCYDYIVSSDAEWSIVLEDDAVLPSNFVEIVDELISRSSAFGADIFCLGPIRKYIKMPAHKIGESHILVRPIRAWNAHAYLINKKASFKLMQINRPVIYMADDWISFQRSAGLIVGGIDPYICCQREETKEMGLEIDRKRARKKSWLGVSTIFYWKNITLRRLLEVIRAHGVKLHSH